MSDPPRYTTDTHPLVWHLRRSRRLSAKAQACFQAADLGQAQIIIPTMVLVEVMYLAEHNRITTQLNEVLTLVRTSTNYLIAPLDEAIVTVAQTLPITVELHDRLIAATAKALNLPLITKDEILQNTQGLETSW